MQLGRTRAALLMGGLLASTLPLTASAIAPHLTCGPKQVGRWESIPVRDFQDVPGLPAQPALTAYTVDRVRPQDVAVTNGQRVQLSRSNGCDWANSLALDPGATAEQPFVGSGSAIVSVALLQGRALAAVREGAGSSSRPHAMRYDGQRWIAADSGLPPAGAPRLLRAGSDGRTAYLTVSPTATGGSDEGPAGTPVPVPTLPPLPSPLPGNPGGGTPTGFLYATTDAGATWTLRTGAADLPAGGTGFSALEVDSRNANWLYGIVNGSLLTSRDGGATFTAVEGSGYTAMAPLYYGALVAFDGDGHGRVIFGGKVVSTFPAPTGITSAAYRADDSMVMVESSGALRMVGPFGQQGFATPSQHPARRGSLLGDNGVQSSFHAVSGNNLLRFVDPVARSAGQPPPLAAGDRSVTPPVPGTVNPGTKDIRLLLGQTTTQEFTLDLPKNPTPLDLFFLVDVSTSMTTYIENLKKNLHKVVDGLVDARVSLRVGVGTMGTGPAKGEAPYPDSYVYPPTADPNGQVTPGPTYTKPRIYALIRPIGEVGKSLDEAINSIKLETDPPVGANHSGTFHEGQLLALEQMVTGSGVKSEQDDQSGLNSYSAVTPGQDARWRGNPDIRRIVVIASDEAFDVPYGTPQKPGSSVENPRLDYQHTLNILNKERVGVFGITAGSPDSVADMNVLARGTHTVAPPGGVSCGGDPVQVLPQGAPLVCSQEGDFSAIISRVLSQLTDRQDVHLVAPTATPVLRQLDESALAGLDVKRPNLVRFSVTVSCVNVQPGTYQQDINAVLRDYTVGSSRLFVTCVSPQAAVPPVPLPLGPNKPPLAPAVQPPVPPPAPPPAAQPQPQPNPNINPLTAGVTQEQNELQVALALQEMADEEEQTEGVEQMAMVDRRSQEEVQALGVLLFAMSVCAGVGLSRLRARPDVVLRRAQ
ncbi:MAG TPA: vWA domain-containing protein [Mycobacteriales bacterium]|nr:vWA domain-containing protein [Mycobacteriales bacterium]